MHRRDVKMLSLLLIILSTLISQNYSSASNALSTQNCACLHNGICVNNQDGTSLCECPDEWFGPLCERKRCLSTHNPCLNQAICEKTNTSFYCHCPIGFGGIYCENRLPTVCDSSNPCSPHGTCRIAGSVDTYACDCHFGFTGTNCSETNFCQSDPCLNGYCENGANGHTCVCRDGWEGENCDKDVDECQRDRPCMNGGKCVNTKGGFYCECPLNFAGERCQRRHNARTCSPNPCLNAGECKLDLFSRGSFECHCPYGFDGTRCEHRFDDCDSGQLTCINGGICVRASWDDGTGKWAEARCKCPSGYTGEFCEVDVNECEEWSGGLCQNGATCYNEHGTYTCLCVGGFKGRHCEINIDDCVDNLCYSGSTCIDGISRYLCMCTPDRIGNLCEFPNPCYNNPCKHSGRCFADPNNYTTYTCQCPEGFKGKNCDEDVDECAENPCFNGQCVNTYGSFRCNCDLGYDPEDNCMTPIKYCDSNPCVNGATCLNDLGKYHCLCLPGYSGKNCEIRVYQEVNNCYLDCKNGGICKHASANRCECPLPYAGILCELEKKNPCTRNECHSESTCVPNEDYDSYTCQCPPHLSGPKCSQKLEPCKDYNPCLHGTCYDLAEHDGRTSKLMESKFGCDCISGFTGELCDKKSTDRCQELPSPCLKGGRCKSRANGYFECECPRGFGGLLCEDTANATSTTAIAPVPIKDCRQKACRNGGTCRGDKEFQCECSLGFSGDFCEEDVNECLTITCENKGRCVDLINGYRCDCAPGWSGDLCATNVDDCANIVCANGGTCVDGINDFRCECARGYVGRYCEVYVPVDKFNVTDHSDSERCKHNRCQELANNGRCDANCNFYACDFDGGDCSATSRQPFERCLQPSYCAHVFRDGVCDEICNSENCLFDGFDCAQPPKNQTDHSCPSSCLEGYHNGRCDAECNVAPCGWDGGDCESETRLLPGELSLVLLVSQEEFFRTFRTFLVALSAHLRVSVQLSTDAYGRPKVFKWRSDSGKGPRIDFPMGLDSATFSVPFTIEGSREKRSARYNGNDSSTLVFEGIQVILRLDMAMCKLNSSSPLNNIWQSSSSASCFTTMDSVASYLGAANAKNDLQDIGMPIYSAQVLSEKPDGKKPSALAVFFSLFAGTFLLILLIFAGIQFNKRTKVKIAKKIWIPPVVSTKQSMKASTLSLSSHLTKDYHAQDLSSSNGFTILGNNQYFGSNAPLIQDGGYNAQFSSWNSTSTMNNNGMMTLSHYTNAQDGFEQLRNPHQLLQPYPSSASAGHPTNPMATGFSCAASSSGVSSGVVSPDHYHLVVDLSLHKRAATSEYGVYSDESINPSLVNQKDARGRTPLHCLFENPYFTGSNPNSEILFKSIHELWKCGADIDAQDEGGKTPLIMAITNNNAHATYSLLNHYSADPNLADFNGKSPLYHAIVVLNLQIVKYLLANEKLELDVNGSRAEGPLMRCALMRSPVAVQIAELLLKKGVNVDSRGDNIYQDYDGRAALHLAASIGNLEMIKLLVEKKAQIDITDCKLEWTPLYVAVDAGQIEAVKLLLTLGADKNKQDINGKSMEKHAEELHFPDIVTLLKSHVPKSKPQIRHRQHPPSVLYTMSDKCNRISSALGVLQQPEDEHGVVVKTAKRSRAEANPSKKADDIKGAKKAKKKTQDSPTSTCPSLLTPPSSDPDHSTTSNPTTPSPKATFMPTAVPPPMTATMLQKQISETQNGKANPKMTASMLESFRGSATSIFGDDYALAQSSEPNTKQSYFQYSNLNTSSQRFFGDSSTTAYEMPTFIVSPTSSTENDHPTQQFFQTQIGALSESYYHEHQPFPTQTPLQFNPYQYLHDYGFQKNC